MSNYPQNFFEKTDLALWSKSVITDTNIIQITEVNNEYVGSWLRQIFGSNCRAIPF